MKSRSRSRNRASGERGVRKRVMANERERERTRSLNNALEILRNKLPVPEAEKRSKIQTLRLAKDYIEFLSKFNSNNDHSSNNQSASDTNRNHHYDYHQNRLHEKYIQHQNQDPQLEYNNHGKNLPVQPVESASSLKWTSPRATSLTCKMNSC